MGCGSCVSTSVQALASITRLPGVLWCCCYAAVPSELKLRIFSGQSIFGETGNYEPMMKSRPDEEAMAELYRGDPAFALDVLNSILADGDQAELLIALRHMTKAFGGVHAVAEQAQLNPTQLYRTLSPQGNPGLSSLAAILRAMGLRLAVEALPASPKSA